MKFFSSWGSAQNKRIVLLFVAGNVLLLVLVFFDVLQVRLDTIQALEWRIQQQQRRLSIMERNLYMLEVNRDTLTSMQSISGNTIHPAGHIGSVLTTVRELMEFYDLREQDFFAREQGEVGFHGISEIRASIVGEGRYEDIQAFLRALAQHEHYYRLERIQVTDIDNINRVRVVLNFSVYSF